MASYCDRACQIADWRKDHKVECKLLKIFKAIYPDIGGHENHRREKAYRFLYSNLQFYVQPALFTTLPSNVDRKDLPTQAEVESLSTGRFLKFASESRACSVCFCNEFGPNKDKKIDWQCCADCNFGWCCSPGHWENYKSQHTAEVCSMYQKLRTVEYFHYQHAKKYNELFVNVPERLLRTAFESFPKSWEEYFRARFLGSYPERLADLPSGLFPATTRLLTQPVTCLYAMYRFGISHFQKIQDLTIHVVGADIEEVPATCVWEEIMHCLPHVRNLTVQFVGPEACKALKPPTKDYPTEPVMSVCPECTAKGRQRLVGMFGYTYHEYAKKYLSNTKHKNHAPPDLLVAFNTGMFEADTELWKTSLEVILDMKVPAYFTCYDESEATQDMNLLRQLNANILQDGPIQNPFREDLMKVTPVSIHSGADQFYSANMYGVLFHGKKKKKETGELP